MMNWRQEAWEAGAKAQSSYENPYWKEYPRPSKLGPDDETAARIFVGAYLQQFMSNPPTMNGEGDKK